MIFQLFTLGMYAFVTIYTVILWKKGNQSAKYFFVAFILTFIGTYLSVAMANGVLPHNVFTEYSMWIGSVFQFSLLALAQISKINVLTQEKLVAQETALKIQRESKENLEREVKERTFELSLANEKLKEVDIAKTQFFANVSHEFRTPLTLILSPIESIRQGQHGDSIDRSDPVFQTMARNGSRLHKLISNILDFTKLEAGKTEVNAQKTDLTSLLNSYISSIESSVQGKGLQIEFVKNSNELFAWLDRDLFEKTMLNLLSNAIKFNRDGGSITVSLQQPENSMVQILVKDTGIGIPTDKLETIFERFGQVDSSSSRKHEGAGIGLFLAKESIELMGGTISVQSEVGKGSTFKILLPVGEGDENEIPDEFTEISQHLLADIKGGHEIADSKVINITENEAETRNKILIVEDNVDMQDYLKGLLEKDFSIATAINGREGLDKIQQEMPDLVLADVMMPEMDGYEMTDIIRQNHRFESIPIVLLTARADLNMKLEGFERGANDYITKPFYPRELFARITSQLDLKRMRDKLFRVNQKLYKQLKSEINPEKSRTVSDLSKEKINIITDFIKKNYDSEITREDLAKAVGLNADHLGKVFNQHMGMKIKDFLNQVRIEEASQRLLDTKDEIITIAYDVGFESLRTFNRVFSTVQGTTPSKFRMQNVN